MNKEDKECLNYSLNVIRVCLEAAHTLLNEGR